MAGCAVGALATVIIVAAAARALLQNPTPEVAAPVGLAAAAAAIQAPSPGLHPAEIIIPAIGVDAKTEDAGAIPGGAVALPSSLSTVGWYKYGVMPGQAGTAVLYARYESDSGHAGVFKRLYELQAGDTFSIKTDDGRTLHFVVDSTATYPYDAVPQDALGGGPGDGAAHAALITGAGARLYDPLEGMTQDHRLVVYATLSSTDAP